MNRKEYNRSVDCFSDGLYRFIYKLCRSKEMAEDVVQDAYLKLWEVSYSVEWEKAKSFLYTTAYHRVIDLFRREQFQQDLAIEELPLFTEEMNAPDVNLVLEQALIRLPEIQKTVVLLRDYEAYSYKEIAEITGLTEEQVKVYIFRARKSLKEYIRRLDIVI